MFLIDVAEWCVEALVMGLAFFFFAVGSFILLMVLSVCKAAINRNDYIQEIKEWITNGKNIKA
tara:strand:+ start:470 stop:658 length:189 start_codon:yes stop_codon:yes gene_type:complete